MRVRPVLSDFSKNCVAVGVATLLVSIAFSTVKSDSVMVETQDIKLQATKSINKAITQTKRTEELLKQLDEQKQAYNDLKEQVDILSDKYHEVKLLKPQIDQIDKLQPVELDDIKNELNQTSTELVQEIDNLIDK